MTAFRSDGECAAGCSREAERRCICVASTGVRGTGAGDGDSQDRYRQQMML